MIPIGMKSWINDLQHQAFHTLLSLDFIIQLIILKPQLWAGLLADSCGSHRYQQQPANQITGQFITLLWCIRHFTSWQCNKQYCPAERGLFHRHYPIQTEIQHINNYPVVLILYTYVHVCIWVWVCAYINSTQMVCLKGSCTVTTIVLSVCVSESVCAC